MNETIEFRSQADKSQLKLSDEEFNHLLFHGFDEHAEHTFGGAIDTETLRILFPPQDFVIWGADQF